MTIEVTAKKVEDAISQGLAQLGATLDDVTVEVVDYGGFLRKAKVRLTLDVDRDAAETPSEPPAAKEEEAKETPVEKKPTAQLKAEKAADKKPAEKSEKKADKAPAAKKPTAKKPAGKSVKNESAPTATADEKNAEKEVPQTEATAQPSAAEPEQKPAAKKPAQKKSQKPKKERSEQEEQTDASGSDANAEKSKRPLTAGEKEAASHALEFVKKTVELMGFAEFTAAAEDGDEGHINITAPEGDDSLIIGRHGETLSALTYLAETSARAEKSRVNILVDCNGYRERRAASLSAMARRRARESASKHRRIKLEPMDRTDRRTIHCALADDAYVTTESEGKEPYRCVVIVPKDGVVADYDVRSEGRDKRRGGRDRNRNGHGGGKSGGGEKPAKRAAFNVIAHGFVGHNDNAGADDESGTGAAETKTDNE